MRVETSNARGRAHVPVVAKANGKKMPNPIDKHVGSRVRMRRMMIGLSQEKLGDGLGLTFQQVQKYEKGTNRIGASRMQQIAGILQVPISFFFEGAPGSGSGAAPLIKGETSNYADQFVATPEGLSIARNFRLIKSAKVRRQLVALIEAAAEN